MQRTPRREHPSRDIHHARGTLNLARALGWFSLALGAVELAAPGTVARSLGARRGGVVATFGAREVAAGIGILAARDPTPWVKARIAGDVLDIAALASQLGPGNARRAGAMVALGAVLGATALDLYCAAELEAENRRGPPPDYGDRAGIRRSGPLAA
ncbi:cyclase dehydrase [uncultured Alsobacter sp.]|uniref:cyclase dehydrase n=1 Tax=uncultured Alsobacter sp. TaxID=1748258 RepID=UPI0025F6863C|nr:cyclase dehydrase [uncultured Alsobacter sp.]